MGIPLKVLFVEDSEADAELTAAELARGNFELQTERVQTEEAMSAALADANWDLVICDYRLPCFSAEGALSTLKASNQDLPFIITSGAVTAEDVVSLLKQGAHDFMDKHALARLVPAVERELREAKIREQRRQAERQVRVLSSAIEQSPVAVVITDPQGRIQYVNPRFEQSTGYSASEALGRSLGFTLLDDGSAKAMDELWSTVRGGSQWSGEFCSITRDGQLMWEAVNVSPLTDEDDNLTHYVVIKEDITVRRSYEEQLLRQAHYDPLTELANRVLLMDRLTVALENAARTGQKTAVLGIDLDHFKTVNDSLGHSVGDNLLKEAAQRLSQCIRGGDTLARMGGDEFVLVLPQIDDVREVHAVAKNIVRQFEKPFTMIGKNYLVTSSVGIALYPDDGGNPHLLLRNADLAMYKAKELGRNQHHFFTEDINIQLMQRLELEERLRSLIAKNELVLHYQPVYDLRDNRIIGFEALARWRQADGSLRMPADFIPAAEEIGIIQEIDRWVLQTACRETAALLNQRPGQLLLAINISPQQLDEPEYVDFIRQQLSAHQLQPNQLELEITERALINDTPTTHQNIDDLCALGVRLAIDDFGTGYSSLAYLQKYPFQTLKIDRSFVSQIDTSASARRLIEAIITMAHGLDMALVGEGIETQEEREFLQSHGCDQGQGFLLSHPLPLNDIIKLS